MTIPLTVLFPSSLGWLSFFMMILPLVAVKALIAIPIAYAGRWKGYGFWEFYFAAFLLGPLTCVAILLFLPKLVGGRVAQSRKAKAD
ncbi:hypothetical protein [Adlercreutzia aquisgranensis]|uniref:hypothetical protein n=1 Tax=Adlercreutzia aquisgranensis TaxID=2941323 RepID=UPI00203F8A52|nr:hypothetical protein [Adlercreutzia aquisgranensis]